MHGIPQCIPELLPQGANGITMQCSLGNTCSSNMANGRLVSLSKHYERVLCASTYVFLCFLFVCVYV